MTWSIRKIERTFLKPLRLAFLISLLAFSSSQWACQDQLVVDVKGGAFDKNCGGQLLCDDALNEFTFLTDEFISNEKSIYIEWKDIPAADVYRLEVADHPSCKDPLFTFEEVNPRKEFTFIKDGVYYFCVHTIVAALNEYSARNNGLKVIIDTTPPIVKVTKSQTILATGGYPVDPEFEIEDLTELSYEWSTFSEKAVFDTPFSKKPGISFISTGLYDVEMKVTDRAGNQTIQNFSIQWQPGIDALVTDLGVRFERNYYQTRSLKKLTISPELSYALEGVRINNSKFYDFRLLQNSDGDFTIVLNKDPLSMNILTYGDQLVDLGWITDMDNISKTMLTIKDFNIFSHGVSSYVAGSKLSGGIMPMGGIVKSGKTELSTGFHAIIHQ